MRDELLGIESKDADFLVPGVDSAQLRSALEPHGRVEELVVAGRPVGQRLYPRARDIRLLAPAGIEFAPPRREHSTGPGRHDFEIVVDPDASIEDDLARRDFTVNAMARRLGESDVLDYHGGRGDLERRVLRTVSPSSFAEDPLRLLRGLRLVSQLDLDPAEETLTQMREEASSVDLVSGERIGGGLGADGMGELSKLLLGRVPAKALRLARDTGVLVAVIPEFEPAVGFDQESRYHDLTVDEHIFAVVQAAADAGFPLRVRLAALFHDLGKPTTAWRGDDGHLHFYPASGGDGVSHEQLGATLTDSVLRRLRYPNDLRERVVEIVRFHGFEIGKGGAQRARTFLAQHGEGLAMDLIDHKEADLRGKRRGAPDEAALDRVAEFRATVTSELGSPHRLSDLAIDGSDLIELGFQPGPELGRALGLLLAEVVEQPELNLRETLLVHAKALLPE